MATAFKVPATRLLLVRRTEGFRALQFIGNDYTGPIVYHLKSRRYAKACILNLLSIYHAPSILNY